MKSLVLQSIVFIALTACSGGPIFDLSPKEDTFNAVAYNNKVDILWVVDTSQSMQDNRSELSNQIHRMFSKMDSKKLDYRMAAVTMDMSETANPTYSGGRFVGSTKIINNQTPNKESAFSDMLLVPETKSDLEKGLDAMKKALSPERLEGENYGFYRPGALLAVIFISDERDWSNNEWEFYRDHLNNFKPNLENGNKGWIANFIGVIDNSGICNTVPGLPIRGAKFIDLVEDSGGSLNSICDESLSLAVDNIQRTIISIITEWKLDAKPIIETITVKMNGVFIDEDSVNGWSYNEEKNSISFHGTAIPSADTKVEIDYKPKELD